MLTATACFVLRRSEEWSAFIDGAGALPFVLDGAFNRGSFQA